MKCSICGNELSPTDKFCNNCGAKQTPVSSTADPSANTSPQMGGGQYNAQQQYGNAPYNGQQNGYPQNPQFNGQQQYNRQQYGNPQQYGYPQGQQYGNAQYNGKPYCYPQGQQYGYPQYNNEPIPPELQERVNRGEVVSPAHVDFSDAVKLFFKNFKNFKGRSTASEYWYSALFTITISFIIAVTQIALSLGNVISGIFGLILIIPNTSLAIRRLHDVGKSGWWFAPFVLYSIYSDITLFTVSDTDELIENPLFGLFGLVIFVFAIMLFIWSIKPSQPFTNKWGPSAQHLYRNQGYGFSYKNPPYINGNANYNYNNNYSQRR